MNENYLTSARQQFAYYQSVGDKTFAQLTDEQLFWQPNDATNSIAIIVNHLHGNMLSRWTDFLTADGEKDWRERDEEFEDRIHTREILLAKWKEGWDCVFTALDSITPDHYTTSVYIRNQAHTLAEAINRQMNHYSYHIGQVVQMAKIQQGEGFQSLTIPKGQSKDFNAKKFAKGKHGGHFSEDVK